MKPLLSEDSIAYKRRLVRALNSEAMKGNGFYIQSGNSNVRCLRARLRNGAIECLSGLSCASGRHKWIVAYGWANDAYGRKIVASRHP